MPKELSEYGEEIKNLSVSRIAGETGKSERAVKSFLTRNALWCSDYGTQPKYLQQDISARSASQEVGATTLIINTVENSGLTAEQAMSDDRNFSNSSYTTVSVIYGVIWLGLTILGFKEYGLGFFLGWLLLSFVMFIASMMTWSFVDDLAEKNRFLRMSKNEQERYKTAKSIDAKVSLEIMKSMRDSDRFGAIKSQLVCPHCQTKGKVRSKLTEDISRTKVVPIIGNTIKSKKGVTQMHCDNCSTTWNV